jgi:hypothetical protein
VSFQQARNRSQLSGGWEGRLTGRFGFPKTFHFRIPLLGDIYDFLVPQLQDVKVDVRPLDQMLASVTVIRVSERHAVSVDFLDRIHSRIEFLEVRVWHL